MEITSRGRSDRTEYDIMKRFRQMSKSKQRRLLDRFKRDQPPTNQLHENISTFRKYGTLTWYRVEDEPPVDPNTATEEQVNDRILFYLNDYLVHETSRQILHRRFCEDFEGWTTATWLKAAKPLRSRLKAELEHRGLTLNEKCKENSDKLADITTRGYETSGETDWGSIMSDDPETAVGKGKQPVYNIAGPAPKTPSDHDAYADAQMHIPAPARVPTFEQGHTTAPDKAPARMHASAPKQTYTPIPPHDTETGQQGHDGYYPSPFAHIRFHGSAEYRSQSLERQQSYHDYYDPREPQHFQRQYSPSHGYSPYHGNRDYREPPQSYRHHPPSHEDPRFHQYAPPIHEPWRQPHFYSVPHGYYPQHPYPYPHPPPPREYVHGPSPQEQLEQARRSNPPGTHNDKEFRRSHPPPPPPPNNDNQVPQTQEYQHRAIESEKRDLERNMDRVIKAYATKDDKYSGEKDDFFRPKIMTFMEHCTRWDIPDHAKAKLFPLMLTGKAAKYYTGTIAPNRPGLKDMITQLQAHFETEANFELFTGQWDELTFHKVVKENPDKTLEQNFLLLVEKLEKLFEGLHFPNQRDTTLRNKLKKSMASSGISPVTQLRPPSTYEAMLAEYTNCFQVKAREEPLPTQYLTATALPAPSPTAPVTVPGNEALFLDRRYVRADTSRGKTSGHGNKPFKKSCFVCRKPGCWSTNHTEQERRQEKARWWAEKNKAGTASEKKFSAFLQEFEGSPHTSEDSDDDDVRESDLVTWQLTGPAAFTADTNDTEKPKLTFTQFFTHSPTPCTPESKMVDILRDNALAHAMFGEDPLYMKAEEVGNHCHISEERYADHIFRGILPDTGATGISTAGMDQVKALMKIMPDLKIEDAPPLTVTFGAGQGQSSGVIRVPTTLGTIDFYVVNTSTPFLYSITDMDKMAVKLDNLENVLIQGDKRVPVVRRWGHPWWILEAKNTAACHLSETEMRRLHRRFGHPSVKRLTALLDRAGETVDDETIQKISKHCHHCQINGRKPGRFRFTLKDDVEFNYEIYVDILQVDERPVLHVVDAATSFQAARFLKPQGQKAADVWNALRECWIDTYLGPPDWIVHDAGKNFASAEFRHSARLLAINIDEVPVEAHHSIGKVERYHGPLRRAYDIIKAEVGNLLTADQRLQLAVKAVNDSAGPDGLIPTLLVFGAYPRMSHDSPPSLSVTQRADALRKATSEARKALATRQVADALASRNGPNTMPLHKLPLQSEVLVHREKGGWQGPFKLLATDGETCTLDMPNGPTNFRSTVVKPYLRDTEAQDSPTRVASPTNDDGEGTIHSEEPPHVETPPPPMRTRGWSRKNPVPIPNMQDWYEGPEIFISAKEEHDFQLALDLRKQGIITTPGEAFEASDMAEIESLLAQDVFVFMEYDPKAHKGVRLFRSRIVREVKGKGTDNPYEKSRLVIQGFSDEEAEFILTQSPTIQRLSQRLIVALAPYLSARQIWLWIRDITQAYVQATSKIQREILVKLPKEIRHRYARNIVMRVIKPLYGISEAGTHWWVTYFGHHLAKLLMQTSTYDPCLLITNEESKCFGIIGMQTDDTLGLGDKEFFDREEIELQKASFAAKPKTSLTPETPLRFNGCILTQTDDHCIDMTQKGQSDKIDLVVFNASDMKQKYVEQRARGAYVATVCQPEAVYDLAVAAQAQDPTDDDVRKLNRRLEWQMNNKDRGLKYIKVDLPSAALYVFADGSLANNKDFSSQIGYVIILGNESPHDEDCKFVLRGNIITYSSTKCKRVTRSALASELYAMVQGADTAIALNTTLNMITARLGVKSIPTIICTDSKSLYEVIVKLGTTQERRLMCDVMALRESYERREFREIRWINGEDNIADAMTKERPNKALETFVTHNEVTIRKEGWVARKEVTK